MFRQFIKDAFWIIEKNLESSQAVIPIITILFLGGVDFFVCSLSNSLSCLDL